MRLRFLTSVASGPFSFMEGQTINVSRPTPEHMEWLRRGVVEAVRGLDADVALAPAAAEQAIARRRAARGRRAPRRVASAPAAQATEGDMHAVPMICPGGTVVCIATGPSLTQADVDACRGKVDGAIVVNDGWQMAPWADALMASDAKWWRHYAGVPGFSGRKYCLQEGAPDGVAVLQNTGARGVEIAPTGLRSGMNSGAAALNVAVHFGAVRVLLLGYDMGRAGGGRAHFFGDHPAPLRIDSPYPSFIEMFETMVEPLRQLGVEVINCSRETALTAFPRRSLADALAKRRRAA